MDKSDFEKVFVSKSEWATLKSLHKNPKQPVSDATRSENVWRFVFEHRTGMGINAVYDGTCSLNPDGENYLAYLKGKKRDRLISQFLIPIVVTEATLAVTFLLRLLLLKLL